MRQIRKNLLHHLAEHKYEGRIVSIQHLDEMRDEIEERLRQGLLDKEFYKERLDWFDFDPPDTLPETESLIVVAVPRPQSQAIFTWHEKIQPLILPPTYVAYEKTRKQVEELLAGFLAGKGYSVARTRLPLKLLAVRSGLARYGRNNISYVSGMGSFLQLGAVYSDMPCEQDNWQKARMMKSCQNCYACRKACPTQAISSDRFLLHAERCIVFHNERPSKVPFPAWINPNWHNCLIGCLHCQRVCPQNKDFLQWIEGKEEFSEEETALLLEETALDRLPMETQEKMKRLNLTDYADSLSRNLKVFFKKSEK